MTTKLTPTSIVMQERGPARQLIMTVLRAKCHLQLLENISTKLHFLFSFFILFCLYLDFRCIF